MNCATQKTISKCVSFRGIGVHTGERSEIVIKPADSDSGIIFVKDGVEIPANVKYVGGSTNSICLVKDGVVIRTIEHLMAAFHGLGIDNAEILVKKGEEIPILDGSAKCFVEKMLKVGIKELDEPKLAIVLQSRVEVKESETRYLLALPTKRGLKVKYHIDYGGGFKSRLSYVHTWDNFLRICSARTFVFERELKLLKNRGLGRGIRINLNTLLINSLSNPEDCARHKILDLLGDLYLLGHTIFGDFHVHRGGHSLHSKFVSLICRNKKLVKLRKVEKVE